MRALLAGLPLVVVLASACSSPDDSSILGETTEGLSRRGTPCSISRSQMMNTTPARAKAIQRGLVWLDAHVPYSQGRSHDGYRTDCSGFVSMCWQLGTSTNTASMVSGSYNKRLSSYDQLLPADALLRNGHVSLFVGWNDAAHTSACLLEEGSSATGTQMRAQSVTSLRSQGFKPIRAQKLASDTSAPASDPTGADDPAPNETQVPTGGDNTQDPQQDPQQDPAPAGNDTPADPGASDPGDTQCYSRTLGDYVPELSCVHSQYDGVDEQCKDGLWYRGVSGGKGPYGPCASNN